MTSVRSARRGTPAYADCFASQLGALGRAGQRRLQRSVVVVVGAGGVGGHLATVLAMTGIGKIVLVDPQAIAVNNFNRCASFRLADVGKAKVDALARFFEGRPHLTILPIRKRAEDLDEILGDLQVDLVVSSSNTVSSRIAAADFAMRRRLLHVSAAVADGRERRGGFVTAWAPGSTLACAACFLSDGGIRRGEALLTTVVVLVSATAATLAVRLLTTNNPCAVLEAANCMEIDADHFVIEPFRVLRRAGCSTCGSAGPPTV